MIQSGEQFDWRFYARVTVAPLALCVVAGFHMARVFYLDQTPWKGGGFGMFSTVDSVAARYLRVYVIKGDTRIPVNVPTWLEQQATGVRTAPSRKKLRRLSAQLAELHWTVGSQRWQGIREQYRVQNASGPVSGEESTPYANIA